MLEKDKGLLVKLMWTQTSLYLSTQGTSLRRARAQRLCSPSSCKIEEERGGEREREREDSYHYNDSPVVVDVETDSSVSFDSRDRTETREGAAMSCPFIKLKCMIPAMTGTTEVKIEMTRRMRGA